MNITDEIDRSIGTGPQLPSPLDRLAAGKSAVRRRRLAGGVASLAVIGLLGGAAYVIDLPADREQGQVEVANQPDIPIDAEALQPGHIVGYDATGRLVRRDAGVRVTKLTENPVDLDGAANALLEIDYKGRTSWVHVYRLPDGGSDYRDDDAEFGTFQEWAASLAKGGDGPDGDMDKTDNGRPAAWYGQGGVHLDVGAKEIQRVDNPMGGDDGSAGLVVEQAGVTHWILVDGGGGSYERADESDFPTFKMWLDNEVAFQSGKERLALVRFGDGEKLVARKGVTIVSQSADPDVDGVVQHPDDLSAVAEVRYQGRTWFVIASQLAGEDPQYFPTVAKPGRATMEEYLTYARTEWADPETEADADTGPGVDTNAVVVP